MSAPRRIVYLGTPQMAVAPLEALVAAGLEVALVVTGVDKRRGRGGTTSPTPVKQAAERLGIPVSHELDDVATCGADLGVVVAYGRIVPPSLLDQVPMVNLHFSLLPRWRGAAPVERAILAGDDETGVCVMRVDVGLDTGDVYACERVAIPATATAEWLRGRLVEVGSRLLAETVVGGLPTPEPQQGDVVVAAKIRPDDLRIDPSMDTSALDRTVRVGGAWTTFRERRVKVLEAVLDDGEWLGLRGLRPVTVQPEGKGPMAFADWARGMRPADGETFV
ncbi:MAG: methionyl-tRNA formyltransferase [Actinomycetota bacterium]